MSDERNSLTSKLTDFVKEENRWGTIMKNKEVVTEKNISTLVESIKYHRESLYRNGDLEPLSDPTQITMVSNEHFEFTLVGKAVPFRPMNELWWECQHVKEKITEYYNELLLDQLDSEGLGWFDQNLDLENGLVRKSDLQKLRISSDLFTCIFGVYYSVFNIPEAIDILRDKNRKATFCLFLWLLITHVKRWVGTATELLEEWEIFLVHCELDNDIEPASVISKNLRKCKDILRTIGIGYEVKNKIYRLWLMDSEVSNFTDHKSGRQIAS